MDQLSRIESKLDKVIDVVSDLRARLAVSDERATNTRIRLDRLGQHLENELERVDDRLDGLGARVATAEGELAKTKWTQRLIWAAVGALPGGGWLAQQWITKFWGQE